MLQGGDACAETVDIAHHQRPRGGFGGEVRPFEELDEEERRRALCLVGGKFPHTIDLAFVGELIGDGEGFVRSEGCGETDVA